MNGTFSFQGPWKNIMLFMLKSNIYEKSLSISPQPFSGNCGFRFKLHFLSASYSPYKVKVLPTHDASKVRASGPGLNTTGVPASLPVEFTIDAKDAGEGLLAVQITVSCSL